MFSENKICSDCAPVFFVFFILPPPSPPLPRDRENAVATWTYIRDLQIIIIIIIIITITIIIIITTIIIMTLVYKDWHQQLSNYGIDRQPYYNRLYGRRYGLGAAFMTPKLSCSDISQSASIFFHPVPILLSSSLSETRTVTRGRLNRLKSAPPSETVTGGQLNGLRLALLMTVMVMRASSTDYINSVNVVRESATDSNQQYDQRSQQQHAIFAVTVMRASSTDCVNSVYTVVCGKRKCIRLRSTLPVTKSRRAISKH